MCLFYFRATINKFQVSIIYLSSSLSMLYFYLNLITIAMYRNENISQGLNNIIYLVKLYNYYERRSRLPWEKRGDTCNGKV